MKGISPVIATVLLLLMAVAAVGGAWVWYQRQSALVSGQTEEKINEQMAQQQAGAAISLAGMYTRSAGGVGITLLVNNAGSTDTNVTGYKIYTGGSTVVNVTMTPVSMMAASTSKLNTIENCTVGDNVKIQLFTAGTSTQEFDETCS